MKIKAIVATSLNNVIGKDGDIPWHHPADLKYFSEHTKGQTVIMGRKTFESLPASFRPLPKRQNIILTRDPNYKTQYSDVLVVNDLAAFMEKISTDSVQLQGETLWVIGGAEVYKQTMSYWDELFLTLVHEEVEGDTYFPKYQDSFLEYGSELDGILEFKRYKKK